MDLDTLQTLIFFILVAFIPSVLWLYWLVKKVDAAPSGYKIAFMFIWGAIFAVVIAVILEFLIPGFSPRVYVSATFMMVVIIAPFAEELAKPLGLIFTKHDIGDISDGIILGATAGLGFAATENMLYELSALESGWEAFWVVALLRSVAACALHASATAVTGWGIARNQAFGSHWLTIIPFYLIAVIIHGLYNFLAIQGTTIALLAAIGLALLCIIGVRKAID